MGDPVAAQAFARLRRRPWLVPAVLAGTLAIAAAIYFLAGWIGSSIPRNPQWREADRGVTILVETNGVHTGVIMPAVTAHKDWRDTFPALAAEPADTVSHIAVGWGEREVFLDVATWSDLRLVTALRILSIGGESLIRTSHYLRPAPGPYHRPVRLSAKQYRRLVASIEASLAPVAPGRERTILRGTYAPDAYYRARGRYTIIRTSNSWTGDVLADAGVEMGWWTPFSGGVMKWIEPPQL